MKDVERVFTTDEVVTYALTDIAFEIRRGEFVAIEGPSGCGKSTLLHVLGLLDRPTTGSYLLAGVPTDEIDRAEQARLRNREIGFVFQSFNLIPEMTAIENVMLPFMYRGGGQRTMRRKKAEQALAEVGMSSRADHYPSQLSGGQQQRVAVARAIAGDPSLLLADEPTGNLDQDTGQEIMALLDALHEQGTTVIMVTHDPDHAARAQRRIQLLDGRIQ
ncbi:ABC transporter ATP-binding protein [Wenzhouxiangella sp. AB-CW3]|nr:ABC transporter ATP-binding protein [Wenzhouxiangella sp. AB-CW3]